MITVILSLGFLIALSVTRTSLEKKIIWIISTIAMAAWVFLFHYDMIRTGNENGLLSSDDRVYYQTSQNESFLEKSVEELKKTKNYGYYLYNEVISQTYFWDDVLEIKLTNMLVFTISLGIFLMTFFPDSQNSFWLVTFLGINFCMPILIVLSINYKDSLLFGLQLLMFSSLKSLFRCPVYLKPLFFIAVIAFLVFIESIRFASGYLILGCMLIASAINRMMAQRRVPPLNFYVCYLLGSLLVVFLISEVMFLVGISYDVEKHQMLFDHRTVEIVGIPFVDIPIGSFLKNFLSPNPLNTLKYLVAGISEHGYASPILSVATVWNSFYWMLLLIISYPVLKNVKGELLPLAIFLLLMCALYGLSYGGMVGNRLKFPLYVLFIIASAKCIEHWLAGKRGVSA